MAFTLSTSGPSQNSYVTRAEADAYLDQSYVGQAAWFALSGVSRDRALVEAFQLLERQLYLGTRTNGAAQLTQFPRDGIANCDGIDQSGITPAPSDIKKAQILLALSVVQDASIATSAGTGSNVRRAKAGEAEVEFFSGGKNSAGGNSTRFPQPVQELLKCYLDNGIGELSFGFGTGEDLQCPDFGMNGGL